MASLPAHPTTTQPDFSRCLWLSWAVYAALSLGGISRGADDALLRTWRAVCQVESGGNPHAVGDGGRALGIAQIHCRTVDDLNRILGRQQWIYEDRRDPAKSLEMFRAYVQHYQKAGGYPATSETWSRLWNGGPKGPDKAVTVAYWRRVTAQMSPPVISPRSRPAWLWTLAELQTAQKIFPESENCVDTSTQAR